MGIMITMISSRTQRGAPEATVEPIVQRLKAVMMNWGIGAGCSSVYAVLILACGPLTAEEIGTRANYAYSSTINHLNMLIHLGLVERIRGVGRNLYVANVNFVELLKAEREKVTGYFNQLKQDLEGIKGLEDLEEQVEHAIAYLKRIDRAESTISE